MFRFIGAGFDKEDEMHALFRFKTIIALAALCLMLTGSGAMMARVTAQDAASTAESPIVGVWVLPPQGEEAGSITSFSADGSLVDHETDGTFALGAWEATGPSSAIATFVFFANDEEFTGNITIRATLEYDDAADSISASYSVTGTLPDGTVVWSSEELITTTLTRLPVEGPEMAADPIGGSSMVRIPSTAKNEQGG
jgi:hypothetical protein